MDEKLRACVSAMEQQYQAECHEFREEISLTLAADQVVAAAKALRDEFGFDFLVDATAVDYWPQEAPRFHVIYQLYSMKENLLLRLVVPLDGSGPVSPSLTAVYPNANWKEREIWDMFGVRFEGHPDPRRIIMPADWGGHPLRKDYPLGYEEVEFSFNFQEINQRKPHGKL
jgi:NADH-quinone oxidoreductase subunit C